MKITLLKDILHHQPDDLCLLPSKKMAISNKDDFIKGAGKNIYLTGCRQSWKYFRNIYPVLKKNLRFTKYGFSKPVLQLAKTLQQQQNCVSLHVRRTDYMEPFYACISALPVSYYENAVRHICRYLSSPVFYVFSDEPEWAENNIRIPFETHIIKGNTSSEDMFLMTQCRHNIIANSTFSWWGAWLNDYPSKIIIAPDTWYISVNLKVKDIHIIPPEWIVNLSGKQIRLC
jgi:hypothetical protein